MPRTAAVDRVRRRPKDRKAQIARVAAEAFSARGYHAVGMDDIAAELGISATALYRHYANKYDLFRAAALALGHQLVDATAFCDELPVDTDPADLQAQVVRALVDVGITNRLSGGLYRWEGRYLQGDDQTELMNQMRLVNRRLQQPLRDLRPALTSSQRWMLSSAALSVIGSIIDHRAKLPVAQLRNLMSELAVAVLNADLPAGVPTVPDTAPDPVRTAPLATVGRYEALLQQSLLLFEKQGYHETSMGEIAAAAGMPTSAIYRYFSGKQDILSAVFRRAADRVSGELGSVLAGVTDPAVALCRLVEAYVASSFSNPELAYVYYAERVNLNPADQELLRTLQRETVETWSHLLTEARPERTDREARFAVHAAMAQVIDVGRLVGYDRSPQVQSAVRQLMEATLGVQGADRDG